MGTCSGMKDSRQHVIQIELETENSVACSPTQTQSEPSGLGSSLMLKCHVICQGFAPALGIQGMQGAPYKGSGPVSSSCVLRPQGLHLG